MTKFGLSPHHFGHLGYILTKGNVLTGEKITNSCTETTLSTRNSFIFCWFVFLVRATFYWEWKIKTEKEAIF